MTTTIENKLMIQLDAHQNAIRNLTLPEALDYVAQWRGDNLALQEVEHRQRSMSWTEFHSQVEHLRSGLEALGLRPGEKVGLLIRNQLEFPITWFAVMGAGAAIVPLNPKYTNREIEFVLTDAEATWLIGESEIIETHEGPGGVAGIAPEKMVAIGASSSQSANDYLEVLSTPITQRSHQGKPSDIVNVQFTSGTTGLPKGCVLTHEYWTELGTLGAANYENPQRFLADHPFYYMQNQAYLAMTIASGGAMYITAGLSRRKFMGWLYDYQIDFAWVDEDMLDTDPSDLDHKLALKFAPVSGMPTDAYSPMEERFGIRCRESYASTELGSGIGVPNERFDLAGTGTMGYCLPNRESKVIDDLGEEVQPGMPGELCMRGKGIMLGYHNRPEANSELFIEGGWFRTGDVVTKTADGLHYFIGRTKDMIRRSGENISALEVETHLYELDGIEEVGVIPVPDPDRDEEVKAIVVRSNPQLTADEIIGWAREGLAPFKVPRYIEFREALPHTGSGKIAKGTLKDEEPFHKGVIDATNRQPECSSTSSSVKTR